MKRRRDHSEDLGTDERTGCIWLRICTCGGVLVNIVMKFQVP
jgi:hypothetical protein